MNSPQHLGKEQRIKCESIARSCFPLTRRSSFRAPTENSLRVNSFAASTVNSQHVVSVRVGDQRWATERDSQTAKAYPATTCDNRQEESCCEESLDRGGLRDRLWQALEQRVERIVLNGHPERRLTGNTNITFTGVNSEALMLHLKEVVAVSSGSACTSADPEPSHVLVAMGINDTLIKSTIRFGIGRFNSLEEVRIVAEAVDEGVRRLRHLS